MEHAPSCTSCSRTGILLTLEEELWELLNRWASNYDDIYDLSLEAGYIADEWFTFWKERQEVYPQEELGGE